MSSSRPPRARSPLARTVDVGGNANVATLTADKVAITLPAGGRYEFLNHNFYGLASSYRMYGVNGVGRAFEFDGTTFTPIRSGMAVDTPHRIAEHYNHLFLAFPGGQLQNSSIGAPLDWSASPAPRPTAWAARSPTSSPPTPAC
jgi:hypothetical protein